MSAEAKKMKAGRKQKTSEELALLRSFRLRGVNTTILAKRAGVCRATFSKMINRKDVVRSRAIACLAVMNADERELVGGKDLWASLRAEEATRA